MKRKPNPPPSNSAAPSGPRYWRSLGELADTPGFKARLEREFPEGASSLEGVDRRHFMKIMAASFALGGAGLAGCRRPEANILPFSKSVEGLIPGLPLYYTTAYPLRKTAIPLLAETNQGRPTKLEGNPAYAPYGGVSNLKSQASVLDLYDPDRAMAHTQGGATLDAAGVAALLSGIGQAHAADGGAGLAFLAGESGSPTRDRLLGKLRAKFPKAIWAEYEPVADDPPAAATEAVFHRRLKPIYRFAKARRILSIDADFFGSESGSLYYTREFAKARRVTNRDESMNRLYMAESGLTLTGCMADHRLRLASSHMLAFAAALASHITGDSTYDALSQGLDLKPEWIAECAADLSNFKGESLVVVGSHLPPEVHWIGAAMNAALGNFGSTVELLDAPVSVAASISDLAAAIRRGEVKALVIIDGNPVYNAPADLDWPSLQKSVGQVVRYGGYVDETSALAGAHIAAAHYLESWGDARTADGTIVPIQPMILPLFGGLTEIEVIARIAGEANADPHALVRETIAGLAGDAPEIFEKFLYNGYLSDSGYPVLGADFDNAAVAKISPAPAPALSGRNLEVRFVADYKVDDGRFANNGWLQECPDPVTRISWDNAILVSPRLGKEMGIEVTSEEAVQIGRVETEAFPKGIETSPIAELSLNGRSVRGPVHIVPGLSNYTVVVALGYGRAAPGRIEQGVGFDAYPLRTTDAMAFAAGGMLRLTGDHMVLANIQEHWSMEGRELVREANIAEYREKPDFAKEVGLEAEDPAVVLGPDPDSLTPAQRATLIPRGNSLYVTPKFTGPQQWGMSIDLNTCIGCNACVVACQAENNIPIVGKDQAVRGREMHWIRIDRYFSDGKAASSAWGGPGNRETPEDPQISLQPVTCMQCELAPCEMVCPVNATVHDEEGLNVMVYNRCIGTRYCANNCPYKVRRFNYFDWNKRHIDNFYLGPLGPNGKPELLKMVENPEVTVRMRGVMEKCTYCVQRIENGKIQWKVKSAQAGEPGDIVVPDGGIRTACQQACPAEAIVFGDILDAESAVSKAKARSQDYSLLAELNTRPRTTYLAKLRNPNPRMPDYHPLPWSRVEHNNKNHPDGFREGEASS